MHRSICLVFLGSSCGLLVLGDSPASHTFQEPDDGRYGCRRAKDEHQNGQNGGDARLGQYTKDERFQQDMVLCLPDFTAPQRRREALAPGRKQDLSEGRQP